MRIVLASTSPRRKELLESICPGFEIIAPEVDETPLPSETPVAHAERLSLLKANAVFESLKNSTSDVLVIASDTIVVLNETILGKPKDYADAFRMLTALSGKTHSVCTAVTLIRYKEMRNTILTESETTEVAFKKLSRADIERYLSMIEWHDKAGSYAVQHGGEMIVAHINGSYTNVIGFPLRKFFSMIVTLNILDSLFPAFRHREVLFQ